jgi:hypothetical protein
MAANAIKFQELYESIEGFAIKDLWCDGCPTPFKKGDKCYASVLLTTNLHPNYKAQKPESWMKDFITTEPVKK